MKRKITALLSVLLSFALTPITAIAAETEPIRIETDTFSYYATMNFHTSPELTLQGTDANLLITGIYQKIDNPDYKIYTGVMLLSGYSERCNILYWDITSKDEAVQVGDLLNFQSGTYVVETNPLTIYYDPDTSTYRNYGNGSALLGDKFKGVIRNEVKLFQDHMDEYTPVGGGKYQLLPIAPEITGEEPQQLYGDFNHDGEVNASDAAIMLIYAAEHGAGTFSGSFEEYVSK